MKKLLLGAAAVSLMAGSAHAVDRTNDTAGVSTQVIGGVPVTTVRLASEANGVSGDLRILVDPSGALFPTGNVLVNLTFSGATFDGALDGTEFQSGGGGCAPTSVISQGGANGGSNVVFLVSNLNTCTDADPALIEIPVDIANGAGVTSSLFLTTDAGAAVDGTSASSPVFDNLVTRQDAFTTTFAPDMTLSEAVIGAGPVPFAGFCGAGYPGGPCDGDIGDINVAVTPDGVLDLAGSPVTDANLVRIGTTITGNVSAFGTALAPAAGIAVSDGADTATVSVAAGAGSFSFATGTPAAFDVADAVANGISVIFTPQGSSIEASTFSASVALTLGGGLTGSDSATGSLQPITREGTEIVFPWTQVGSVSAMSGVNSVYRIGNLAETATGAVFVEVDNWTTMGFTNPGTVQIASSIAANGELVVNAAAMQAALGDYGRGDVRFTVEENSGNITGRLFQVLNGQLIDVQSGTVAQDQT